MILPVYNLEFRPKSMRLEIGAYTFERVANYKDQQARLHCLLNFRGPEFSGCLRTGEHAHTANVTGPDVGPPSVIPWPSRCSTALYDILLLLKLFTRRDVFIPDALPGQPEEPFALLADPRMCPWGGVLACSLPYQSVEAEDPYDSIDTTLQVFLPQIYDRMRFSEWQRRYKNGYFLVLLGQAIQQRTLEAAFVQCWTICEHLFACFTDSWMSSKSIRNFSAQEKIAFLLVHFEVRVDLHDREKSRLDDLANIRNRLVHFGRLPERDSVHDDAIMFIRLTEYFAAKALGLYPSDVFNTVELLEEFLTKRSKGNP